MISNLLVGRLRTVASFVPQFSILADIGCDHGLLSVGLSQYCSKVWAIDVSPLAIRGAMGLVLESGVSEKVTVAMGDGLSPLILNDWKCDTVVTAGMGTSRVLQILTNNPATDLYGDIEKLVVADTYSNPAYYDYIRPRILDFSDLSSLGVNRIITQPWPPNMMPVHALHSTLLDNGWHYEDQGIDATCSHHVTTCFTRNIKEKRITRKYSDSEIFNLSPLAMKNSQGKLSAQEKKDFRDYLMKQKKSLIIKIEGQKIRLKSAKNRLQTSLKNVPQNLDCSPENAGTFQAELIENENVILIEKSVNLTNKESSNSKNGSKNRSNKVNINSNRSNDNIKDGNNSANSASTGSYEDILAVQARLAEILNEQIDLQLKY